MMEFERQKFPQKFGLPYCSTTVQKLLALWERRIISMVDANVNIIDIYMCLKKAYFNENQLVGKLRQKIALCFVKSLVCVTSTVRLRGSILWFFGP